MLPYVLWIEIVEHKVWWLQKILINYKFFVWIIMMRNQVIVTDAVCVDALRAREIVEGMQGELQGGGGVRHEPTDLSSLIYLLDSALFCELLSLQDELQQARGDEQVSRELRMVFCTGGANRTWYFTQLLRNARCVSHNGRRCGDTRSNSPL